MERSPKPSNFRDVRILGGLTVAGTISKELLPQAIMDGDTEPLVSAIPPNCTPSGTSSESVWIPRERESETPEISVVLHTPEREICPERREPSPTETSALERLAERA